MGQVIGKVGKPSTAIDLFAGAGGSTAGLKAAGFSVVAAVEIDSDAAETYRTNHSEVDLREEDIRCVNPAKLRESLGLARRQLTTINSCPPCQGWSTLGPSNPNDSRNELIDLVLPFVEEFLPRSFILENVPGIRRDRRFSRFIRLARKLGYGTRRYIVDAADMGAPQRRRRLIVLGVLGADGRTLPNRMQRHSLRRRITVKQAWEALRSISPDDPLNVSRALRPKTLERIAAIPVGGNRFDLPRHLVLDCHKKIARQAGGPYGRLKYDEIAPTMTTRCTTPSCGSFIHPTEHRGITLREAALLQSFPVGYKFIGKYGSIENQIGNAVPVAMTKVIAGILLSEINNDDIRESIQS